MSLHPKRSLVYLPICLLPLLLLAALNYWNGLKTVEATLGNQAQRHLNSLAGEVDRRLEDEQIELTKAALSTQLRDLLLTRKNVSEVGFAVDPADGTAGLPGALFVNLTSLLKGRGHFSKLAVFDQSRVPVFEIERRHNVQTSDTFVTRSGNFSVVPPSSTVKNESGIALAGASLRYSVPIPSGGLTSAGMLVAELNLAEAIADSASVLGSKESTSSSQNGFVTVVDSNARIIFHPNPGFQGQLVSGALPEFLPIAEALSRNTAGLQSFRGSGDQTFITAFSPLPRWNVGLAVGYDKAPYVGSAHRWGLAGFLLALVGGFVGTLILSHHIHRKSAGIVRVEEELTAIAQGELDRHIALKSSDDARAIADSINAMTEKMRAQIAREEESRQFQAFARLSAMLTHDLKNAIEALSLIVGNMELHFDNAEFRADAMKSLTSATDKLKTIVARLNRPLTSLSGEHPVPTSVDLIPIVKRVAAMTAEPLRDKHTIEMKLPKSLFVYVGPERLENVIENLILNALEAMSDSNGKLTIEAGVTPKGKAMFSVSDTGPGMSKTFIDTRLFRPFSTTKKNGIGLGLYTCREIVEASAGVIEVESIEGVGTTFRVVVPSASHDSRN